MFFYENIVILLKSLEEIIITQFMLLSTKRRELTTKLHPDVLVTKQQTIIKLVLLVWRSKNSELHKKYVSILVYNRYHG